MWCIYRFDVPFLDTDGNMYGRPLSSTELMLCYSIPEQILPDRNKWNHLDSILDSLLPGSLPFHMVDCIASSASCLGRVYDSQILADDDISHGARCFLQSKAPSHTLDWKSGYHSDNDTKIIMAALPLSHGKFLLDSVIASVAMGYRQHLRKKMIHIMGVTLCLSKPVNMQSKYITLLLVPLPLRCKLFSHYYDRPSGGHHMGCYKTLFRLRLRFFWSSMREEIK